MKIIPTNDEFEAVLNTSANEVQELMPFHQIFLMEALRYSITGNCEYFLPMYNAECGVIIEPPVDIIISCEGAIPQIKISPDLEYDIVLGSEDSYPGSITWQIEVDGVLHDTVIGLIDSQTDEWLYMEDYIQANLGEIFSASYEEGINISNVDNTTHRVKLIPSSVPAESPIDTSDNPTYSVDSTTGIITFCLGVPPSDGGGGDDGGGTGTGGFWCQRGGKVDLIKRPPLGDGTDNWASAYQTQKWKVATLTFRVNEAEYTHSYEFAALDNSHNALSALEYILFGSKSKGIPSIGDISGIDNLVVPIYISGVTYGHFMYFNGVFYANATTVTEPPLEYIEGEDTSVRLHMVSFLNENGDNLMSGSAMAYGYELFSCGVTVLTTNS